MHDQRRATSSHRHNIPRAIDRERAYEALHLVPEELPARNWLLPLQALGIGARVAIWLIAFLAVLFGLFTYPAILIGVFLFIALLARYLRPMRT